MKKNRSLWRALLFFIVITALCGSFAIPVGNLPVSAAPQMQTASCSSGTLIAKWTFNGNSLAPTPAGSGTLSNGTGLNGPTFPAGQVSSESPAISFSGWTTNATLDPTDYIEFKISTLGTSAITLAFDSRISATGPATFEVHYSTDGTTFIPFGLPTSSDIGGNWDHQAFDFSSISGLNNATNVFIRLYGYSSGAGTGTWRVDNVVFCGTSLVTIDSIAPNPTNSGTVVTWHALANGNYEIRLGGTNCTDGTAVNSGTYTTSPNTVPISINGSDLADGANTIRVCLTDSSGNTSSAVSSITKDVTVPTVTVNQDAAQADPTSVLPIKFAVAFSEPITTSSFTVSDITHTGTATGITWTITDSGDQKNFVLQATSVTGAGMLIPSIAAGKVTDLAGNSNVASISTDNKVTYSSSSTTSPLVLINEVAWSGTAASSSDEWIELHNTTSSPVDITNWKLYGDDNTLNKVGSPNITLKGTIPANGYFLLERDEAATDIPADQIYSGELSNTGERLYLKDNTGKTIDTANSDGGAWPAGTATTTTTSPPAYASMERVGTTGNVWVTYQGTFPVAHNRNGGDIKGTPGEANWITSTTVTTITSDLPDPSYVNASVTVRVTVVGGTSTPTGTVTVAAANSASCTITLASGTGSCILRFTSAGTKTITATYRDTSGIARSNDTESHIVLTSGTIYRTPTPIPPPPPQLVVINEFVPRPGHDWNHDGVVNVGDEYIELLNHGTVDVNLSGWRLDDEVNVGSDPYSLPAKTIKPGERIVFYGADTDLLLGDGGDAVRLLKPNGQLIDAYNYTVARYPDESFCRLPDNGGADDWNQFCFPTPGIQNSLSGNFVSPSTNVNEQLSCPISDTLPQDFVQAECDPFGKNIWSPEFWDRTGWYDEKNLPSIDGKWPVFAN